MIGSLPDDFVAVPRPSSGDMPSRLPALRTPIGGASSESSSANGALGHARGQPERHDGRSRKAILAAFFANLGIAVAKFVGFAITGAASLLAEAIHSRRRHRQPGAAAARRQAGRAKRRPSHPFGYGRERYFWAFVVALVLFRLGGLFALFEGIEKLRHPHEVENLAVAIGILVFAIVPRDRSRSARRSTRPSTCKGTAGRGGVHPPRRSNPSCRSCCSRTSAPRSVCSSPSAAS